MSDPHIEIYKERLSSLESINLDNIIKNCWQHLPQSNKRDPWFYHELDKGKALLQTQYGMDCYMASYGEMHYKKCRAALQRIDFDRLGNFEIWDWGCGQGIASLTLLEMLMEKDKLSFLKKITLVEPSLFTLNRAKENIRHLCPGIELLTISKYLPSEKNDENNITNITYITSTIIHLFSNILDIETINLKELACEITQPYKTNYIMSFGPLNPTSNRLTYFASLFEDAELLYNIETYNFGFTSTNKKFSCKSICLKHSGGKLNLNKTEILPTTKLLNGLEDDYDLEGQFRLSGISKEVIPFYNRLMSSKDLNSGDSVYINPSIGGNEVDILILRPQMGILLIRTYCGTPDITKVYRLAEDLDRSKKDIIRHHLENVWDKIISKNKYIWSTVKTAIYFTDLTCDEIYDWLFKIKFQIENHPNDFNFSINNWEKVCGEKLCGFNYTRFIGNDALSAKPYTMRLGWFAPIYNNSAFDDITYRGILKILAPKWHRSSEGEGLLLDGIPKNLYEYPSATRLINGVAGSGKTQILVQRAVNTHIATGDEILILSYNITLANYISFRINQVKADFSLSKFKISSYHRYFKEQAVKLNMKPTVHKLNSNYDNGDEDDLEFSYDDVEFFAFNSTIRYNHIFIDEIQDFKPEWIEIIKKYFLSKNGEIIAFGDASQNIYHRPVNKETGFIQVGLGTKWNNTLTKSHRFKNSMIANFVVAFHNKYIQSTILQPIVRQLDFDEFQCLFYYPLSQNDNLTTKCIDIINTHSLRMDEVVVLSNKTAILRNLENDLSHQYGIPTKTTFATKAEIGSGSYQNDDDNIDRYRKIHFTMDQETLKLSTIYSFKGWESKHIVLIIDEREDNHELIYTGLTRAKEFIHIINVGNLIYDAFFRDTMNVKN